MVEMLDSAARIYEHLGRNMILVSHHDESVGGSEISVAVYCCCLVDRANFHWSKCLTDFWNSAVGQPVWPVYDYRETVGCKRNRTSTIVKKLPLIIPRSE